MKPRPNDQRAVLTSLGLSVLALLFAVFLDAPSSSAGLWVNGAFLLVHVALCWRARDERFRHAALSIAPIGALLGMLHSPHGVWFLLFAAQLYIALFGLLRPSSSRRSRGAALLGLFTLIALPLGQTLLVALPRGLFVEPPSQERERRTRRERSDASDVGGALRRMVDSGVGFGSSLERLQFDEVLEVRGRDQHSRERLDALGTLYFRGSWLDTITAERTFQSRDPETVDVTWDDAADGTLDGWTRLTTEKRRHLALAIRQQSLAWGQGKTLVLSPVFVQAVELPSVEGRAGGILVTEETEGDWLEYEAWIADPSLLRNDTPAGPTRVAPRFLQLPTDTAIVDRLRTKALEVCAGVASDRARLERLVEWFHTFDYDLNERGTPGLGSIEDFLERRSGYCTYFAVSAVLLLRTLEIPARVTTGFIAEGANGNLVATTRSAHAWIEVPFADEDRILWRAFDPTPASGRREALFMEDGASGLEDTLQEVADGLATWARTGEASSAQAFFVEIGRLPKACWEQLRNRPMASAILAILVFVGWAVRRWKRVAATAGTNREIPEPDALAQRLIAALRKHGAVRRRGMTLRELVRAFERSPDQSASRLGPHVEALYRARFGGRELDARERDALIGALEHLE